MIIVAKSNGTPRFLVDRVKVHHQLIFDQKVLGLSMPTSSRLSWSSLFGGRVMYITLCDLRSAYHQVSAVARDKDKTAVVTQNGK